MKSKAPKIILLLLLISAFVSFFVFDLGQYLSFDYLKSQQSNFQDYYAKNQALTLAIYFLIYVVSTALSLPGAAILTLAGGALFGNMVGVIVVSFASTIGATCAFLASRYILRDYVQEKFKSRLKTINKGIEKEGGFYLFTLRLIPAVPFFVINMVMGLTNMGVIRFFIISQVGMLAGTFVYVNAGTQIGQLDSPAGILSPNILISFVILGLFPLIAKKFIKLYVGKLVSWWSSRKVYSKYKKPMKFDYNVIAIGGGAAGLVTSYIGAAAKAKVALIEADKMGGDCLNYGCVPSKAIIRTAKFMSDAKKAQSLGIKNVNVEYDFADVMERVQRVVKTIEPHDSVERYTGLGVSCYTGYAKIKSPWEVEINGEILTTKNIVIASGAGPFVPNIEGLDKMDPMTSENLWNMREQPKKLLVLGGGPIGSELAQAFHRVGCNVTQLELADRILVREDKEVSDIVMKDFKDEGINLLTEHKAVRFYEEGGKRYCVADHKGEEKIIEFDKVIVALGRKARVTGFGLEELGIELTDRGTIQVNDWMQTNYPNIYACGDVVGPYQFTHMAAHQAWFCAVNAMASPFYSFDVDYSIVPWCTYTDPEIARCGLNETEAKEQDIPYEVSTYDLEELDRAITEEAAHGLVKVLTVPGKDKIIGVTIVGMHAGDYIAEFVTAMKYGLGMNKILGTIHIYPTLAEANKYAAGAWKKNHVSEKTLNLAMRFNSWRRT